MKRPLAWVTLLALAGVGVWAWLHWSSSPEKQVRKRLQALEEAVSFDASDGMVSTALDLDQLGSFFTDDAEVNVTLEGEGDITVRGRAAIVERAKATRFLMGGLEVDFLDVVITVAADGRSAVAEVTGSAVESDSGERWIQELRFHFRRTDDGWRISAVETIPMLSGPLAPKVWRGGTSRLEGWRAIHGLPAFRRV